MQYAVVEFFRNVIGLREASHAETDGVHAHNVVTPLACSLYGQEARMQPVPGSRFARWLNGETFVGMHYCNYSPHADRIAELVRAGMSVEATRDDGGVEVLVLANHPFFVLSLFQPQIGALAGLPLHPLLREFVGACVRRNAATRE